MHVCSTCVLKQKFSTGPGDASLWNLPVVLWLRPREPSDPCFSYLQDDQARFGHWWRRTQRCLWRRCRRRDAASGRRWRRCIQDGGSGLKCCWCVIFRTFFELDCKVYIYGWEAVNLCNFIPFVKYSFINKFLYGTLFWCF